MIKYHTINQTTTDIIKKGIRIRGRPSIKPKKEETRDKRKITLRKERKVDLYKIKSREKEAIAMSREKINRVNKGINIIKERVKARKENTTITKIMRGIKGIQNFMIKSCSMKTIAEKEIDKLIGKEIRVKVGKENIKEVVTTPGIQKENKVEEANKEMKEKIELILLNLNVVQVEITKLTRKMPSRKKDTEEKVKAQNNTDTNIADYV